LCFIAFKNTILIIGFRIAPISATTINRPAIKFACSIGDKSTVYDDRAYIFTFSITPEGTACSGLIIFKDTMFDSRIRGFAIEIITVYK
jgi:hypothetical protein